MNPEPPMQSLKRSQIIASETGASITLIFQDTDARDAAFRDLARLQVRPTTLADVDPLDASAVARQLDMLAVIHATASVPDVDLQSARSHLIYILGITHGLIRNLGGTTPPIPEGLFGRRSILGQIQERPAR